jgi:hypothetical protein
MEGCIMDFKEIFFDDEKNAMLFISKYWNRVYNVSVISSYDNLWDSEHGWVVRLKPEKS